jgi:hypothetical protein
VYVCIHFSRVSVAHREREKLSLLGNKRFIPAR